MVLPLVALAVLAIVVSKSLMSVVAHEHGVPAGPSVAEPPPHSVRHDDARALLSPAAADHAVDPVTESNPA